jgi:L-asparaginase II
MTNPVLVEVERGHRVESCHRGAVAVVDTQGRSQLVLGDATRPIFPRSAVKALQALPLIETGAADHYGLGDEELALAASSHSGEPAHVAGVERMLKRCGLDATALACGIHWPLNQAAAYGLARSGRQPSALHNNCSGKHAGFICVACTTGVPYAGYASATHPVQREVRTIIEGVTGVALGEAAIDGCSVPTWALPLTNLAHGLARFGTGDRLPPDRAKAAAKLRAACAAKPFYTAGTGRFCTVLMEALRERLYVKAGAEGVLCAALPQQGLGIAVKCEDGAARGAEVIMAALITRFLPLDPADRQRLDRWVRPVLRNWNGNEVGVLRPVAPLMPSSP